MSGAYAIPARAVGVRVCRARGVLHTGASAVVPRRTHTLFPDHPPHLVHAITSGTARLMEPHPTHGNTSRHRWKDHRTHSPPSDAPCAFAASPRAPATHLHHNVRTRISSHAQPPWPRPIALSCRAVCTPFCPAQSLRRLQVRAERLSQQRVDHRSFGLPKRDQGGCVAWPDTGGRKLRRATADHHSHSLKRIQHGWQVGHCRLHLNSNTGGGYYSTSTQRRKQYGSTTS